MSAIEDIIAVIQTAIDEVDSAMTAAVNAATQADDAVNQAMALGANETVGRLQLVKDEIEAFQQQLQGAHGAGEGAQNAARAAADGG